MVAISPHRAQQSYRHEAFLWHNPADYVAGLAPFLAGGLDVGEATMVAVVPEHKVWLQDALGARADEIDFVDMRELGRNPARIIPAWQEFLDTHSGSGRPVRGIGEPIWPGRSPDEVAEGQLHEALLNVAVDPELPFWLICPYDVVELSPDVVAEAHRSHPVVVEAGSYQGSSAYLGRSHADSLFGAELSAVTGPARTAKFRTDQDVRRLLTYTRLEFYVAGLPKDRASDLAGVVQRLASSSLHRGSEGGSVQIWSTPDAVICEVADGAVVSDLLLGRRAPFEEEHDALWEANQVCDLVQLRSTETGTAVRIHTWK